MKKVPESFYEHTHRTYSDPAAVELYIARVPATRADGLRPAMDAFLDLLPAGGRVLDIGSGTGIDVAALRALGFRATGLDASPAMVQSARDRHGDFFTIGDVRHLELGPLGLFDGVLCIALLLHILRNDAPAVIDRLRRLTRPGGSLLLVTKEGRRMLWDRKLGKTRPRGVVFYTARELRSLLTGGGFSVGAVIHSESPRGGVPEKWVSLVATAV